MSRRTIPPGIYAAMITPLNDALRIDAGALAQQVQFLAGTGIDGIFACASTGEFMNLSFAENVRALDIVAQANAGRKPLVCGACATNVVEAERYICEAAQRGYLAAVICPPYYVKLDQSALIDFFKTLADNAAGLPILLYNVPQFASVLLLPMITALMEDERIAGIKDSSAAFKQIAHMTNLRPDTSFRVFCGTDDIYLPAMAAGCDGIMTALACVLPEPMLKIKTLFECGDIAAAQRVQQSVLPIIRLADSIEFPLGYKLIAAARGLSIGKWYQNVGADAVARLQCRISDALDELLPGGRKIY